MSLLFKNARLFSDDFSVYSADVGVKSDTISEIGNLSADNYDRVIDLKGNILLPGFKNAHTHSAMTSLRSFADGYPLQQWLNEKIFPAERKLTSEDIYIFSTLAFMEYASSGITACFDMYFKLDDFVKAATEFGFRAVFCDSINDFGGTVEEMERDYEKYNSCHPLISYNFGFHAEYTTSLNLMKSISNLANKYNAPVFTHISETKNEVEDCKKRYGKTPPVLFEELGLFNNGGGGFHCVHFENEDFEVFKRNNLTAVTCPASNLKLSSGIAPVCEFINKNINIAIGTDGPASNNALDFFREIYLADVLQNLKETKPFSNPEAILSAATKNGACAMGLYDCNEIAVGKKADITVIDLNTPNTQPMHNIAKNIVYSGSKSNIKLTMINGRVVYENGNFPTVDANYIYNKANELIKKF